ncbi:MAG: malonic semialdehyde reductase [Actinomycetales bacterium]|nr:malonic semialdehyde reductase [Actinomycetales bacterium]
MSPAHPEDPNGRTPFVLDPVAQDALFRSARTARAWDPRPVSDEHLAAVYELLRWGPTAMNTSPLRLVRVATPGARERLAIHLFDGNRERVRTAPLTLVIAADAEFHTHLDTLVPHMPDAAGMFADADGRVAVSRDNTFLQAGYLITALRASGLDVGPMGIADPAGLDADLLAGTSWRSLMIVNAGWPAEDDGAFPRAPRLEPEVAIRTV